MKKIKVLRGKDRYDIYIEAGSFDLFNDVIDKKELNTNILFVVDENVMKSHYEKIKSVAANCKKKYNLYIMPSGESNKSTEQYYSILSFLADNNYGRDSLIAAIGGGVTGDIAGFAASTYMRGIQLVQIPTTLLASVDSSIGGKTGINFLNRKNIIGTFYQPDFVLSDSTFLSTLPEDEFISGTGEIIKYAFLSDRVFYNKVIGSYDSIISRDHKTLDKIITVCVKIKAEVVTEDERESGIRKILNLGHTFAHAYESYFNFGIKHGTAVAAGIISSLFLSYRKGIINKTSLDYFLKLPSRIEYPRLDNPDMDKIINIMLSDKKNKEGGIRFVLIKDIGEILIDVEAKKEEIIYAIQNTFKLC
jgi:3-dehydroquinate synthase